MEINKKLTKAQLLQAINKTPAKAKFQCNIVSNLSVTIEGKYSGYIDFLDGEFIDNEPSEDHRDDEARDDRFIVEERSDPPSH